MRIRECFSVKASFCPKGESEVLNVSMERQKTEDSITLNEMQSQSNSHSLPEYDGSSAPQTSEIKDKKQTKTLFDPSIPGEVASEQAFPAPPQYPPQYPSQNQMNFHPQATVDHIFDVPSYGFVTAFISCVTSIMTVIECVTASMVLEGFCS